MNRDLHDLVCDALMRALEALGREDVNGVRVQVLRAKLALEPDPMPAPVSSEAPPRHFSETDRGGDE